ncbi:MAG: rhodanese-like domain-containing protein [Pseudomonadota bacterium]
MRYTIFLTAVAVAACAPTTAYDFRDAHRPVYEQTVTANELRAMQAEGAVTVIDVRLAEDFDAHPQLIPGAAYRDPDRIDRWASSIPKDRPVVVYCVGGRWVSQKAAQFLADDGHEVYSLDGGLEDWENTRSH